MKIWQDNEVAGCAVTLTSCDNPVGTEYCWGDASWTVSAGCVGHALSLDCYYHGAMGGTDRLSVTQACATTAASPPPSPPPSSCAANTDASSALAVTVANGRWKLDGDEAPRLVGDRTYHFRASRRSIP